MSRCIAFQLNTVKFQTGRFRNVAAGFLFYRDECGVPVRCLEEAWADQPDGIPSGLQWDLSRFAHPEELLVGVWEIIRRLMPCLMVVAVF